MSLFRSLFALDAPSRQNRGRKNRNKRPALEALETRNLLTCNVISGHVFFDVNNNGLMDSGEQTLAGVPVELRNAQNVIVGSTVSDANGFYQFEDDATISTAQQTLTKTISFPETQTNFSLSGLVGQFNPALGELVSIEITNAGTITSDIRVENTSSSSPSTINGTVGGKLTLTGPGGVSIQTNLTQNAGTYSASTYDGQLDFAGNSGKDFGNKTANGSQTVTLTGANMAAFIGTGNVQLTQSAEVSSTATGGGNLLVGVTSTGSALVTVVYKYIPSDCLKPGAYTIIKTGDPTGYFDGKESRNGTVLGNAPGTSVIPLTLGEVDLINNDFGEIRAASLSGFVYGDTSQTGYNDGTKQNNELGINGVTINLDGTSDVGPVHITTTTDGTGFYRFGNLRPGVYSISETQPAGWNDGKDTIGTPGGAASNDQLTNINLPANFDGVNNNFGELKLAQLSGTVFADISVSGFNNGVQDNGEQGIAGVTIQLNGIDLSGQPFTLAATTDSLGRYSFTSLPPGTYTVVEIQPSGYIDGKDAVGSLGGQLANDQLSNISLPPGGAGTNYNFGELIASSISGFVYADLGQGGFNDGIKQAGEQGIASATVSLDGSNDIGAVHLITTTDNNGFYRFNGLRPGTYTITETQPAGWIDGKDTIGTPGGTALNDQLININLPAAFEGVNNNFGEIRLAQISGTVYHDGSRTGSNNGIQDAGEPGIANVTIQLSGVDTFGHPIAMTITTTDANGRYSFTNLVPGTYSIIEIQPDYLDGKDTVGSVGGSTSNDVFSVISLAAGAAGTQYNFGELVPSTISGYVYYDTGSPGFNDGVKQAGEQPIAGVLVTLTGSNDLGSVSLQRRTDATGFYAFTGLRPGTYTVNEAQPEGVIDGKDSIGVYGGTTSNDMFAAIVLPSAAHDYNNNFGELKPIILVSHEPELPECIGPEVPTFSTPPITITTKGQLLASTVNSVNLSLNGDARFINALYSSILGRSVEQSGLVTWLNFLRSGGSRNALAQQIWNSAEHRAMQVRCLYEDFLDAAPDQGALQYYVGRLQSGVSELEVAAVIAGGPHVAALYPSTSALVIKLFDYALGRAPDQQELAAWSNFAGDRVSLARAILNSDETLGHIVQHTYLQLLNRPAAGIEQAFRISQLHAGGNSYQLVIADIFASSEFAARVGA